MMGWYIASTLSSMLATFLMCVILDKLKRRFYKVRQAKLQQRKKSTYSKTKNGRNSSDKEARATLTSDVEWRSLEAEVEKTSSLEDQNETDTKTHQTKEIKRPENMSKGLTKHANFGMHKLKNSEPKVQINKVEHGQMRLDDVIPITVTDETTRWIQIIEVHPDCPIHGNIGNQGTIKTSGLLMENQVEYSSQNV